MATQHPTVSIPKEIPCGCVQATGAAAEAEGGKAATGCSSACCGEGCRCMELKGKCDCAERLKAHETTMTEAKERVPRGCILEAGSTAEACPTCGVRGCTCIQSKGRCDCAEAK